MSRAGRDVASIVCSIPAQNYTTAAISPLPEWQQMSKMMKRISVRAYSPFALYLLELMNVRLYISEHINNTFFTIDSKPKQQSAKDFFVACTGDACLGCSILAPRNLQGVYGIFMICQGLISSYYCFLSPSGITGFATLLHFY